MITTAGSYYIVGVDYGNSTTDYSVMNSEGKIVKTGFFPSLFLPIGDEPVAYGKKLSEVDGQRFCYGVTAAQTNLTLCLNPRKSGSAHGKCQNLPQILTAVLIEAGLITESDAPPIQIDLRIATPWAHSPEQHQDMIKAYTVKTPDLVGGHIRGVEVLSVSSFQEGRTLLAPYGEFDAVVDSGGGTVFQAWNDASGIGNVNSIERGIVDILADAVRSQEASAAFAKSVNSRKRRGVMSPEGLAAALATGKAFQKDSSIVYQGVDFAPILKPRLERFWHDIIRPSINAVANSCVPAESVAKIGVAGGGAALLQRVLGKEYLNDDGVDPMLAKVVWVKKPALALVTTMVKMELATDAKI